MTSLLRVLAALSVVLVVLGATSCDTSEASGKVVRVSPERAVGLIAEGDHAVIDLRTPEEYDASHVVGAVNIDATSSDFEERVSDLDPGVRYLVYGRTREKAAPAADAIARAGIERVVDAGAFGLLAIAGAKLEGRARP